jgi:hypothetical protein
VTFAILEDLHDQLDLAHLIDSIITISWKIRTVFIGVLRNYCASLHTSVSKFAWRLGEHCSLLNYSIT